MHQEPIAPLPIPQLSNLIREAVDQGKWPRYVQHNGKTYDAAHRHDQNCIKMILIEMKTGVKSGYPNRANRRASEKKQRAKK